MTRIQIQQTPGAIQIESKPAQMKVIRSRRLELNIRQTRAEMNIKSRPPRLSIDQSECFATSGLKTPLRMSAEFYQNALAAGLEAIAAIAQEGLRFLRIERGGNPIREIAMTRGIKHRQITLQAMPAVRPNISFEQGQLEINWTPPSLETNWEVLEAEVEFIPQQVSIVMNPYPSIEISEVDEERNSFPEEKRKKE